MRFTKQRKGKTLNTVSTVNPSDFKASLFAGSSLDNPEKERVLRNIVRMCQIKDEWFDFPFTSYQALCPANVQTINDKSILDELVKEDGVLDKFGKEEYFVYSINDMFFRALAPFIDPSDSTPDQVTVTISVRFPRKKE